MADKDHPKQAAQRSVAGGKSGEGSCAAAGMSNSPVQAIVFGSSRGSMNPHRIHFVLDLNIHDGKFPEFERVIKAMTDGTAHEPGALAYEFYLSSDNKHCRLLETYADPAAVRAHITGGVVQQLVPKMLELSSLARFEVYGEPDAESAARLRAIGAEIYPHWNGLENVRPAAARATS